MASANTERAGVGIAWMVLATFLFTLMNALVRQLTAELPPFEITFFRTAVSLACMVPWLAWKGVALLRTRRPLLYLSRARVSLVSVSAAGRAWVHESRLRRDEWLAGRLAALTPAERDDVAAAVDALDRVLADA